MTSVALEGVTKVFPGSVVALDQVSLDVADGEFLVLLGPSGCGKSTLLRIVAGLESLTSGTVLLDGEPADDAPPRERGVAMVFQDYALYPHMDVADNIGFPLKRAGLAVAERERRTGDAASALGIAELLGRRIQRLSGGQRQRVAIGRAIVREPRLFLLDEPLSNLDAGQRAELRSEITGLARQLGVTVIYVTHDQTEALTMADRVAILRRGVLQDVGTASAVYQQPATTYVATFMGNPRISLAEAAVQVYDDSHIALVLGEQVIYLPWSHSRTRILSRYHGERIIVGMRAEALTPVADGSGANVLVGRVRSMEHHGHETLVFMDIGAVAVAMDETATPSTAPGRADGAWLRPVGRFMSRRGNAPGEGVDDDASDPQGGATGKHHRRTAELALRLQPYPPLHVGDKLTVAVDVEAMHFFNLRGQRIGMR